jgi:hypothetical protein
MQALLVAFFLTIRDAERGNVSVVAITVEVFATRAW